MAITDVKRRVSESEKRLCLLYVLQRLELRSAQEIWPFIAQLDLADYFSFGENLTELIQSGELGRLPMGTLYVSESGRKTLELFQNRLPSSLRKQIDAESRPFLLNLVDHLQASARYENETIPGRMAVSGCFREAEEPTLRFWLESSKKDLCESCFRHFRERLPRLISLLQGWLAPWKCTLAKDEIAFAHAECGTPLLQLSPAGGSSSAVKLETEDTLWRLQMQFPDEETASRWAAGTDALGVEAVRRLGDFFL